MRPNSNVLVKYVLIGILILSILHTVQFDFKQINRIEPLSLELDPPQQENQHISQTISIPSNSHPQEKETFDFPIIEVFYKNIIDLKFGLANSLLTQETIDELLTDVQNIWLSKRIRLRFHRQDYVLDSDRSLAFLFYVIGHPRISPNKRQTEILVSKEWVIKAYSTELNRLEPVLDQFLDSSVSIKKLQEMILRNQRIGKIEFEANFPEFSEAFYGLIGESISTGSEDSFITLSSFNDLLFVKNKPSRIKRIHLAFRLFYLEAGLSTSRSVEFAEAMADKPMLFLHYAIGRDVDFNTHRIARTEWEFANTFTLYPISFYHDMNGRGSTNWMDVLFRTSSCWEPANRNLTINKKNFGLVPCRWGIRKWEKRSHSTPELSRMIAHEIGHCLGLEHFDPHCIIFDSVPQANLMQQQRVFSLSSWVDSGRCTCITSSCGDCKCPLDEETFKTVGESRYLTEEQMQLAFDSAKSRDHFESSFSSTLKIGPIVSPAVLAQPISSVGMLLETSDSFVLLNWGTGLVQTVRFKIAFMFPSDEIELLIGKYIGTDCAYRKTIPDIMRRIVIKNPYGSHVETILSENNNDFILDQGESLWVQLVDKGILRTRVRFAESSSWQQDNYKSKLSKVCVMRGLKESTEIFYGELLFNYDIATLSVP